MKTIAVIITAFVLIASASIGASTAPAQTSGKEQTKTQKSKALYVCPMHPEVTSDKPGTCPKCKMELVKQEQKTAPSQQMHEKKAPAKKPAQEKNAPSKQSPTKSAGERSVQSKDSSEKAPAEKAAVTYTCPMHPDVVSDKPGKCPRCKMDLVKNTNDR